MKNALAVAIDLDTNIVVKPKESNETPYFPALPPGRYNVVVRRKGYSDSAKIIKLNCVFVDEDNVFDEIVFVVKDNAMKTYVTSQSESFISPPPPLLPTPPGAGANYKPPILEPEVSFQNINERAVFLPQPVFSGTAEKVKNEFLKTGTFSTIQRPFLIEVNVLVDETGKVTDAGTNPRFAELAPAIIENAKKARFTPFKVRGKPAKFRGQIIYKISE